MQWGLSFDQHLYPPSASSACLFPSPTRHTKASTSHRPKTTLRYNYNSAAQHVSPSRTSWSLRDGSTLPRARTRPIWERLQRRELRVLQRWPRTFGGKNHTFAANPYRREPPGGQLRVELPPRRSRSPSAYESSSRELSPRPLHRIGHERRRLGRSPVSDISRDTEYSQESDGGRQRFRRNNSPTPCRSPLPRYRHHHRNHSATDSDLLDRSFYQRGMEGYNRWTEDVIGTRKVTRGICEVPLLLTGKLWRRAGLGAQYS